MLLPRGSTASLKSRFTSYQRDQESGLDYAMNRYFSNANGRFISPDKGHPKLYAPITLNRFVYAMADPVNYRDPDGNIIAPGPYTPPPPPPIPPEMPIGGGSTGITTGTIGEEYQNPAPETIAAMASRTWCRALIETLSGNSICRALAMYSDSCPMIDLSLAIVIGSICVPLM